jgi:NAD(P)-dependent dehydrogenase (short-subunit alcohol dehydrogenase family)
VTVTDEDRELLTNPPNLRLDGKVVWITGASRGLGRALAFAFAGVGAEVLLCARSTDALGEVAGEIREHGGVAEVLAGSISDQAVIAQAAGLIDERWGKLDALINNAGISPAFVRAERLDDADWQATLAVNLSAPLHCCQAALPWLEHAGGGSIVNISSIHGTRAHERLIAYAATKGALEMVTRTLAVEWAPRGIRVNSLAPGYLETEMTVGLREHERWRELLMSRIPVRRFATVAEVIPIVLLMAGPGSSYMTGTTVYLDGGWTAL